MASARPVVGKTKVPSVYEISDHSLEIGASLELLTFGGWRAGRSAGRAFVLAASDPWRLALLEGKPMLPCSEFSFRWGPAVPIYRKDEGQVFTESTP